MELGVKSVLIDVLGDQDLKGGCDGAEIWPFAAPETIESSHGRVDRDPSFQNFVGISTPRPYNCYYWSVWNENI